MIRTPPPDPPSPASAASGTGWRAVWQRWWSARAAARRSAGQGANGLDLAAVIGCAGTAIAVTDRELRVVFANSAYGDLSGLPDSVGMPLVAALPAQQQPSGRADSGGGLDNAVQGPVECRHRDGGTRPAWMSLVPIRDAAGAVRNHVATFTEIGALVVERDAWRSQALLDPLTKLPNRRALGAELSRGLARARRHGCGVAVLFIDLDHFKQVNDRLGHEAGDRLLKAAAQRMQQAVRQGDLVARLGGDEFVVMLEDVRAAEEAQRCAADVLAALAKPFDLGGLEAQVTASIGMALFPDDAGLGDELLQAADAAMYAAKQQGRNGCARLR